MRARRAMSGESAPVALVSLVRRNRRRYGGYIVHVGMALLFVGVAASSAFQHARDVRCSPGQTRARRRLRRHLRAADRASCRAPRRAARADRRSARCCASARRQAVATLRPSQSYFPSLDPSLGPVVALLRGRGDERGRRSRPACARDLWTAIGARHRDAAPAHRGGRPGLRARRRRAARARGSAAQLLGAGAARPRRALRDRPAARDVPAARLAAGDLDLDRRADRLRSAALIALWPPPGGAATRRVRAPLRGPRGARARPRVALAAVEFVLVVVVVVALVVLRRQRAAARGARAARDEARRAPSAPTRGRPRGQVPRDPRRRARLPHRQALRGRLARAGPRAAAPRRSRSCGGSTRSTGREAEYD